MFFVLTARRSGAWCVRRPEPVAAVAETSTPDPGAASTPLQLYGDLFVDVQMQAVFIDSKTFADATPRCLNPAALRALYGRLKTDPGFSLLRFVHKHFDLEAAPAPEPSPSGGVRLPLQQHIRRLWPHLLRRAVARPQGAGSLLPLPHAYVVPGGRFCEMYYWDSHFIMLGLVHHGRRDLAQAMLHNIAHQISTLGHAPNGNRSYLSSRSQPPFFYRMVRLLSTGPPAAAYAQHLPQLMLEHAYWMAGEAGLEPGQAVAHVVRLPDGSLLNRYWDACDGPREESYREDVRTAHGSTRPAAAVWRDLRAAAESGWDFSSRWCGEPRNLSSIETTQLLPVDLNSLLWGLECAVHQACLHAGDGDGAAAFARRAQQRRAAIERWLWHEQAGHFVDCHWVHQRPSPGLSGAALMPLYVGLATTEQARRTAQATQALLLRRNGLLATTQFSGQQWDAPNGWAPLQWIAVAGLRRYGQHLLAQSIASRWLGVVERVYEQTGQLMEKYDVCEDRPGGGGEYPTQDGFGWTNGVVAALSGSCPSPPSAASAWATPWAPSTSCWPPPSTAVR